MLFLYKKKEHSLKGNIHVCTVNSIKERRFIMQPVPINELKPGDIFLSIIDVHDTSISWISRAIALITHSDVSHAMLYMGDTTLSDEGLSGLQCHKMTFDSDMEPNYVYREMTPADKKLVLDQASRYIALKEPYNMSGLVLLGFVMLYENFPVHIIPKKLMNPLIKIITTQLDDFINHYLHEGKKPMTCSQYVYQCFYDAGNDYVIQLSDPLVGDRPLPTTPTIPRPNSLLTLSTKWLDSYSMNYMQEAYDDETFDSEAFLQFLQQADVLQAPSEIDPAYLLGVTDALVSRYHRLFVPSSSAETLQDKIRELIDEGLFVAPSDLKHTHNLTQLGTLNFKRVTEPVPNPAL